MRLSFPDGCAITNPESVFVLPNVSFEGIKSVESTNAEFGLDSSGTTPWKQSDYSASPLDDFQKMREARLPSYFHDGTSGCVAHHGTVRAVYKTGETRIWHQNTGHFGCLDSPDGVARMHGARVFSSKPDPAGGNC